MTYTEAIRNLLTKAEREHDSEQVRTLADLLKTEEERENKRNR